MEVLTCDRRAKSQLSILLRELGYTASFHDTVGSLEDSLNQDSEARLVLVDLSVEFEHEALAAKYSAVPGMRFIGLQFFSSSQDAAIHLNAKHYRNNIVLPAHAERAKSRLRNVLAPKANQGSLGNRLAKSSAVSSFAPKLKTRPPFSMKRNSLKETSAFRDSARYLSCRFMFSHSRSRIGTRGSGRAGRLSKPEYGRYLVVSHCGCLGLLYAGRLCPGGNRPHSCEERLQHHDEEHARLQLRGRRVCHCRLRHHVWRLLVALF